MMDGTFVGVCIATFLLTVGGIVCGAMEWNDLTDPDARPTVTIPEGKAPGLLTDTDAVADGAGEPAPEAVPEGQPPAPPAGQPDGGAVTPEPPPATGGGTTPEPPAPKPDDGGGDGFEWGE
jgi:hypothetical protein